jgi:hypothetical protein
MENLKRVVAAHRFQDVWPMWATGAHKHPEMRGLFRRVREAEKRKRSTESKNPPTRRPPRAALVKLVGGRQSPFSCASLATEKYIQVGLRSGQHTRWHVPGKVCYERCAVVHMPSSFRSRLHSTPSRIFVTTVRILAPQ